jgi:diguanylate cyclase (GGDEF)-like protein
LEKIWTVCGDERYQLEYRTLTADGVERWIEAKGRVFFDLNRRPVRVIGTAMDITERKRTEKQMHEAVQHDTLTGLPNRALLHEYCSHILAMSARANEPGAVIFIDLDRFKPINDMYGHNVGDKVLQAVAKRLLACSRKEDVVSRLGGDEFIVVLPRIGSARDAAIVARHMLQAIGEPISIGPLRLSISPSIGVSLFPEHATDLELLIRCADMAMYAAKRDGRNNFRIYSPGLIDDANGLLHKEVMLKHAVENDMLELFYQPILDTQSGELIGVEALIRIATDDGILLGPAEFIPVAETTGLMNRIGDWVVRQACLQHQDWCNSGLPPVTIAINVSPMQFRQPSFVSVLANAIKEFDVDPAFLQIEVTESAIMDDVPDTVETLNRLQAMGIRIALDDFGTGYSSLSHLSNLPLNKLKIDQSFIRKMADSPSSRAITKAIIGLGRTLNLTVVGEGIESEEAMEFLRDHGCDQVQGFLFSRPLPPDQFVSWCRNRSVH